VKGRELDVLAYIGIQWRAGVDKIDCPYRAHGGKNDWRWDSQKSKAICTCNGQKYHSIFDVVTLARGGDPKNAQDFGISKITVAEIIGRTDLIRTNGEKSAGGG